MNEPPRTAARVHDRAALQRRTIRVLLVSQLLAGAGLSAGITVGALLAEDMLGSKGSAGVPALLFTIGSAGAALLVGRLSQARGRRIGLTLGFAAGSIGGAGVVTAAAIDSVALLLPALFIYGSGMSTNLIARYAGADLAAENERGRALSFVLFASTIGAVAGPNLVGTTGGWAEAIGAPRLAGPFMLSTVAFGLAALAVMVLLRPDPLLVSREIAADEDEGRLERPDDAVAPSVLATHDLRVAASVMVLTQMVMVAIMTMTPIHMRDHGHSLSETGMVISMHIAAMFMPSPLTGIAIDRFGRRPIIAAAGVTLLLAGLIAAVAPPDSMMLLTLALVLLGLGWNFGLLSGTAMVTDAVPPAGRAIVQGRIDLLVALSGATGGLGSGFVVAASSYATLSLIGGALSLALIPLLVAGRKSTVS